MSTLTDLALSLVRSAAGCRSLSSDSFRVLYAVCSAGPERIRDIPSLVWVSGIPKPVRCLKELREVGLIQFIKRYRKLDIRLGTPADFDVWRNKFLAKDFLPLEKAGAQ
jgi:hypothetical protein